MLQPSMKDHYFHLSSFFSASLTCITITIYFHQILRLYFKTLSDFFKYATRKKKLSRLTFIFCIINSYYREHFASQIFLVQKTQFVPLCFGEICKTKLCCQCHQLASKSALCFKTSRFLSRSLEVITFLCFTEKNGKKRTIWLYSHYHSSSIFYHIALWEKNITKIQL